MRQWYVAGLMVIAAALGGCTHVRGVVVEERTGKPFSTAVFTVGRPDGIGVFQTNSVDRNGRFDFQISPTDESALYVHDSSGDVTSTMRRIDHSEISDHMRIVLPRMADGAP